MIAHLSKKLLRKLSLKEYREEYVAQDVRFAIAHQIRALREQRGWSQADLAIRLDTPQSTISRIEDPEYGKLTTQTLIDVAAAFDVALSIRFISFPEMVFRGRDVTPASFEVESFNADRFRTDSGPILVTTSREPLYNVQTPTFLSPVGQPTEIYRQTVAN